MFLEHQPNLLSANIIEQEEEDILSVGANICLLKPIDLKLIEQTVNHLLN
ncbi:MAG: hypothetical protein AB1489_31470 [Acidobacteriota bacterium]